MGNDRLSQISTPWTDLAEAHRGAVPALDAARGRVLMRYSAVVYRYLLGAVRDRDVADDLFQEFALRLMRGAFRSADPSRGRFRDFLKVSLGHLVTDYHRNHRTELLHLSADIPDPAKGRSPDESEDEFLREWRGRLIDLTLAALEDHERRSGHPLHTLLRAREENPKRPMAELAALLSDRLGRELSTAWVYKHLHLARRKFAELLVEEVAQTLHHPDAEELAQELSELGLLRWCEPALRGWRRPADA